MEEERLPSAERTDTAPERSRKRVLVGCGILAGAVLFLLLLGVVVIAVKGRDIAQYAISRAADAVIEASSLSDEEKAAAKLTVRRFVRKAMAGEIPKERFDAVMEEFMRGTFRQVALAGAIREAVRRSDMNVHEREKAEAVARRFYSGIVQKKISPDEVESVMAAVPKDAKGAPKKPPWDEAELAGVLRRVEAVISDKRIEERDEEGLPDFADDIRRAVRAMKKAMGEGVTDDASSSSPSARPRP